MDQLQPGAQVRFTDEFLEACDCAPFIGYGYEFARVVTIRAEGFDDRVSLRWSDGTVTVSNIRYLTTETTGKYAKVEDQPHVG